MVNFTRLITVAASAAILFAGAAHAQDPIRLGLVYAMSGPYASAGESVVNAIKAFQQIHGTSVAGREVEIIIRDSTGPAPDVAGRLATELATREHVDILTGLDFTPNAMAIANVANRAGLPVISMNATGLPFTEVAKLGARFSYTQPQITVPLAQWAQKNDSGRIYTIVADFLPGVEAEEAFTHAYTAAGGEIAGSVRIPMGSPDFSPFMQRIREAKPDTIFVFLPSGGGDLPTLFFRAYRESGLADDGVQVIGTGETDERTLETLGDSVLGVITAFHYSSAHDTPENKAFVQAFEALSNGKLRASFSSAQAFDTMAALYKAIESLKGEFTSETLMAALRGHSFDSLRGPIAFDDKGEIIQNVYIRRVERVDGRLQNVEFDVIKAVPGRS